MKKIKCIIIFLFSSILLCACAGAELGNMEETTDSAKEMSEIDVGISSDEKTLDQLVTKIYSDEELDEIVKFRMSSFEEVHEAYPIECFRMSGFGYYKVAYAGEKSVVIMKFDKTGLCYASNKYDLKNTKDAFNNLKIGDTLGAVRELDPYGDYPFLRPGNEGASLESTHCTTDGHYITIQYGYSHNMQSYIVEWITFEYI